MSIGKMQHYLTLQTRGNSADGGGGGASSWSTLAQVWGRIEAQGGGERFFGDQNEGRTTHKITIRFRRDLTTAHRILYAYTADGSSYTRTFNIRRIENKDERDKYLEILADEGVAT